MFDETVLKDLVEMYGKNLTFTDIETVGSYLFKDRALQHPPDRRDGPQAERLAV